MAKKSSDKHKDAPQVDLSNMWAIVTGASPGSLGYETAKTLARWGAHVCVTTRKNKHQTVSSLTEDLKTESPNAEISGKDLDLSDAQSVNDFISWYLGQNETRLDILVNNAGIHQDLLSKRKEPLLTPDGHEIHWRTNYLGTAHLTHGLLPLLRQTGKHHGTARVVNVGSQLHSKGSNDRMFNSDKPYNSWKAYGTSKLALMHFANEIQRRYADKDNLQAYNLHPGGPGGVSTNIARKGLEGHKILQGLMRLGKPLQTFYAATTEEGAQTQIFCATSPSVLGGQYYQNCLVKESSRDTYDRDAAIQLWDETVSWTENVIRAES